MPARIKFILIALFLFAVFIIFSYFVHKDIFTSLDFDTTVRLQDKITRRIDEIFSVFSDIGNFEVMLIILIVIFLSAKKFIGLFSSLGFFAVLHIIELIGKFYISHLPPPHFLLRTTNYIDFPQFHVRSENSYPSGHAGRAIFISSILLIMIWSSKKLNFHLKLFLSLIIIGFDILMLVSRVYLGEHWTTDVIGGTLLGASFGILSVCFFIKIHKLNHSKEIKC